MIDFGSTNDNDKYILFDKDLIAYMDGFRGMLFACRVKLKSGTGTWGHLIGKWDSFQGWTIRFDYATYGRKPEMTYEEVTTGTARYHRCTTELTLNDWYSLVFSWGGSSTGRWYINGVLSNATDSLASSTSAVWPDSTLDLHICGAGGFTNRGAAVEMDNMVVYPNLRLTADEADVFAQDYHSGDIGSQYLGFRLMGSRDRYPGIPSPLFWWPGDFVPGQNILTHEMGGHETGTIPGGTPVTVDDDCDSPPWLFLNVGGDGEVSSMSAGDPPGTEAPVDKMPAALYAEVTDRNNTYLGLQLQLPDSNTLGFASAALPTSELFYPLKAKSFGKIERRIPSREPRLSPVQTQVVFVDHRREVSRLLAGVLDGRAENSPALIRLVSPDVDSGSWMTVYEGILLRWKPKGNIPEVTLHLGPNDLPMRSDNKIGFITRDLFPNVPAELINEPMKAIYGVFDSIVGGGPIACQKINTDGTQYLVSAGQAAPLQAYKAAVMYDPRSSSTEYTITVPNERVGRWFTEVNPIADAGSDEVTVDVEGASSLVATSFSGYPFSDFWRNQPPITNPAEQLLHILVNWVYGTYKQGAWLSPSASTPVNAASFIEVAGWFRKRGMKGRTIVYANETGYQIANRWSTRWRIPLFWNNAGQLEIKVDEHAILRGSQPHLIDTAHCLTDLVRNPNDQMLADQVKIAHGYDWLDERYTDTTRAIDLTRGYDILYPLNQDWSVT